jgi:3-oxoacyl-[acyl-carrier protein] reductase
VNNAGLGNYKNLVDTSVAEYDELMNSNVRSGFVFSRHAVPVMLEQKSGQILFISSVAGLQGAAGESVYSASKFAQIGFAQSLDAELRKHGIKVGTICPGGVKSEFAVGRGRTPEGVQSSRMMNPAEVADAIVFACLQPANVRIPQMIVRHMG